jgi:hypothetical protein
MTDSEQTTPISYLRYIATFCLSLTVYTLFSILISDGTCHVGGQNLKLFEASYPRRPNVTLVTPKRHFRGPDHVLWANSVEALP